MSIRTIDIRNERPAFGWVRKSPKPHRTWKALGEHFGCSRTQIQNEHDAAIAKIKDALEPLARELGIIP